MPKLLFSGVLFAICLLGSHPCYPQWTQVSTGMYGGPIWQLVSHNGMLFAGTGYSGVFASTNNGVSWASSNQGLSIDDSPVNALVFSDNAMYISFNNFTDGVSVSKDNGATWSSFSNGLTTAVTQMARSADHLFALGNDGKTVFLRTESDSQWQVIDTGLSYLQSIAINGNNLFVGSGTSGVYLSSNNGATWTPVNSGVSNLGIYSLGFSGSNLIAGTTSGVFVSSNNGSSWSSVGLPVNYGYYLSLSDTIVFASSQDAVYRSIDSGVSWSLLPFTPPGSATNQFAVNGNTILAGTKNGVYVSSNDGTTWTAANNGLTITPVLRLANSGNTLLAGTYEGQIFVSTNKGSSWSISNTGLPVVRGVIESFAVTDSSVFVAIFGKGIYKSANNVESWTHVTTGMVDSTTIALGGSGNTIVASSLIAGTFISKDNGGAWSASKSGLPDATMVNGWLLNPITSFVINANVAYALVSGTGVYASTNNGPWSPVNSGSSNPLMECLVFNNGRLYAGTAQSQSSGLYVYDGTTWLPIDSGINYVSALAENGNMLFAGGFGVGFSSDGGTNWSVGDDPAHRISSLLIVDNTLFAGTTAGVWSAPLTTFPAVIASIRNEALPFIGAVYPNPGSEVFYVPVRVSEQLKGVIVHCVIYNAMGSEVADWRSSLLEAGNHELSWHPNLSAGLYVLKAFSDNEEMATQRVIIK
jgi:hypothetical protein